MRAYLKGRAVNLKIMILDGPDRGVGSGVWSVGEAYSLHNTPLFNLRMVETSRVFLGFPPARLPVFYADGSL